MTFPITDAQVERAVKAYCSEDFRRGKPYYVRMRAALEAALDRRKGERDRRKVLDWHNERVARKPGKRSLTSPCGRRATDRTSWLDLPLAEPPIQVSPGMVKAGFDAAPWQPHIASQGSRICTLSNVEIEAIYRAMEAKRIEEQKAQEGAPCGADRFIRRVPGGWPYEVPNERSGQDRRSGK